MKTFLLSCVFACMASGAMAQGYQFTDEVKVPATPVKNQAATAQSEIPVHLLNYQVSIVKVKRIV